MNADSTHMHGGTLELRSPRGPEEFPRLVEVWRSAVEATHDFLAQEHLEEIRAQLIPGFFPQVELMLAEQSGEVVAFIGVAGDGVEMLFVDAEQRGWGIGTALLRWAIAERSVTRVDVNEQNPGALAFYRHHGFRVTGRSALDGEGRAYPLLHLERSSGAAGS